MQKNKNKDLQRIKLFYLSIIALTAILILPTHIFPFPLFLYARFPHYLEKMAPFLGVSWPLSFEIYHYVLIILVTIMSLNILGVMFSRWKKIGKLSSFAGLFLTSLMVLFFFLIFITVNALTAIAYGLYSVVLLKVNILTFKTLIKS